MMTDFEKMKILYTELKITYREHYDYVLYYLEIVAEGETPQITFVFDKETGKYIDCWCR